MYAFRSHVNAISPCDHISPLILNLMLSFYFSQKQMSFLFWKWINKEMTQICYSTLKKIIVKCGEIPVLFPHGKICSSSIIKLTGYIRLWVLFVNFFWIKGNFPQILYNLIFFFISQMIWLVRSLSYDCPAFCYRSPFCDKTLKKKSDYSSRNAETAQFVLIIQICSKMKQYIFVRCARIAESWLTSAACTI